MAESESLPVIKNDHKKCRNCDRSFNKDRQPRILNCLHTFCAECLEQKLHSLDKSQITCPKCRQVQKIAGSVDTLPLDPVKARLVEYDQIRQQKVLCSECTDEANVAAESRCQECKVYMCKDCTHVHKRHRLTKDHDVITLEQMSSQPLTSYGSSHFCKRHTAFQLDFYCTTCSNSCCASCTQEQEHKMHTVLKATEAAAKKETDVESVMKEIQKFIHPLRTVKTEGEKQELALQKIRKESELEINDMFDRLEKAVKERRLIVLKEYNDQISKLLKGARDTVVGYEQNLEKIETATSFCTQVKKEADSVEKLELLPIIKSKFQTLNNEIKQQKMNVDKTTVGFVPLNEDKVNRSIQSLGKVANSGSESAVQGSGSRGSLDSADGTPRRTSAMAEVSPRPRFPPQLQPGQTLAIGQFTVHFATADITTYHCDVIVSSTTKHMSNDCGVALPIARAAGASLERECKDSLKLNGPLPVTGVVITTGGNLPSKHVLHACRPFWSDYTDKARFLKDLYTTILRCFCETCNLKAKSVALPAVATGMAGVPQDECAKLYVKAVRVIADSTAVVSLKEVHFVDISDKKIKMIREAFAKYHNTDIAASAEEAKLLGEFLKNGAKKKVKP